MSVISIIRFCLSISAVVCLSSCSSREIPKPNVILIVADDLGYGDIGCFGSEKNRTPNLDQMALEGMRFTNFYSTSGVCTPSRTSIMTGCYAQRLNMHVDENSRWVLFPNARKGLNPEEETIAELLKTKGYATACIGKWHLGDQPEFLPTRHGFDYYFGIPYSNDMNRPNIPLPIMRNEKVIEAPVDQVNLTKRYTEEAIKFIEENKSRPFFIYLPHTFPHLPLYATNQFKGKSKNGRYGDAVEELDWSTGEIMQKLRKLGIEKNTMIMFTSDNGSYNINADSNKPFKGKKGDTDEGSMRIPFIVKYPAYIPRRSSCTAMTSTMDLLPTITGLAGTKRPDKKIDGKDIWNLMRGKETETPHKVFYYYHTDQLQAVRYGKWKMMLPQKSKKRGWSGRIENFELKLYNLSLDRRESNDVSSDHPEVVLKMYEYAKAAEAELGNNGSKGTGQRPAGWVQSAKPLKK